jgi:hypothetical protein
MTAALVPVFAGGDQQNAATEATWVLGAYRPQT